MGDSRAKYAFSIIIPLEFHRGQAVDCLKQWGVGQTLARENFEIILMCPPDFPEAELREIRTVLAPWDRVIPSQARHDMSLCVEGAQVSLGEVLFFTESHCIPEPDTLERSAEVLRRRSEWAGFSCRSVPITHNFLSTVEADFYERDIQYNMSRHPWRKVLDQCFVIQRAAYFQVGGLDSELGHFAEWLLAARFSQAGLEIGYAPEVRVRHFYIGEWDDWLEFTEDFCRGQMRYFSRVPEDPCHSMFEEPAEWTSRFHLGRLEAKRICRMLRRDLKQQWQGASSLDQKMRALWSWPWPVFWRWYGRRLLGISGALWKARLDEKWAEAQCWWALLRRNRAGAERAMTGCCEAIAHRVNLEFLREWQGQDTSPGQASAAGTWLPHDRATAQDRAVGFYGVEERPSGPFRWSEPAAFIELNIAPGQYRITLQWHPEAYREMEVERRYFWNDQPVPGRKVKTRDNATILSLNVKGDRPTRLGWVCEALNAPGDSRALGLAPLGISWEPRRPAEEISGNASLSPA